MDFDIAILARAKLNPTGVGPKFSSHPSQDMQDKLEWTKTYSFFLASFFLQHAYRDQIALILSVGHVTKAKTHATIKKSQTMKHAQEQIQRDFLDSTHCLHPRTTEKCLL